VALAEPTSALGLWPQVRDSSIGWPETDEDAARALAETWRTGSQQLAEASGFDTGPVAAAWPDSAGVSFAQRVRNELGSAEAASDRMQTLANRCDQLADVVIGAKTSIRTLIDDNLDRYASTRALAPEDRASVQGQFVQFLAGEVNRIVLTAAEQIGGPLTSDRPPPQPPPPPPPAADPLAEGINGLASLGNAALNNPLATVGLVGGGLLAAGGAVAVAAGGGLSLTGAGAIVGTPLAGAGVAGVAVGGATALAGAGALVAAAQNEDRVTPLGGSAAEPLPDRETALAKVKEQAGVPADAEPVDEISNASGVQYVYDVDGETVLVTENTMDRSHPGQAHWEAGPIKENMQIDNYGRYRVRNEWPSGEPKSKVDFE
jgi:hypothetical protein